MTAREATVAYMRALAENERHELRLQKAARRAQEHANVMLQRALAADLSETRNHERRPSRLKG